MDDIQTQLRNRADLDDAKRYALAGKRAQQPQNTRRSYLAKQREFKVTPPSPLFLILGQDGIANPATI